MGYPSAELDCLFKKRFHSPEHFPVFSVYKRERIFQRKGAWGYGTLRMGFDGTDPVRRRFDAGLRQRNVAGVFANVTTKGRTAPLFVI